MSRYKNSTNGFRNTLYNTPFSHYPIKLHELELGARVAPAGRVLQSVFWLRRDGYPLGITKLRHALNDMLRVQGGHIGYCVRPGERGKGYGRLILKKTLLEAKHLNLRRVLLTVSIANVASRRVIEANGGVLTRVDEDADCCYYWITLR